MPEGGLRADKLKLARRAAMRWPAPIASGGLARARWQPGPRLTTALGGVQILTVGAAVFGSLWALLYALAATVML